MAFFAIGFYPFHLFREFFRSSEPFIEFSNRYSEISFRALLIGDFRSSSSRKRFLLDSPYERFDVVFICVLKIFSESIRKISKVIHWRWKARPRIHAFLRFTRVWRAQSHISKFPKRNGYWPARARPCSAMASSQAAAQLGVDPALLCSYLYLLIIYI